MIWAMSETRPELVRAPSLAPAPFAHAAIARGSGLVLTAGACPVDAESRTVGAGDVRAQARQAMANLTAVLAAAGATLPDVLHVTVYVATADRVELVAAWDEVATAFGTHPVPGTLLGVTVLGYDDQLVEVQAVAQVPPA